MKNKKIVWWLIGIIAVLGLLFWAGSATRTPSGGGDIVATNGIHWHPELTIYVDGDKQEIPANIGLAGGHQPMHTHVEDAPQGVLHFEFGGAVRTGDLRLGNFFRIWGNKDIQTAFGTLERMTVNGEENMEYGDYEVQSEDKIELYYTTSLTNETHTARYQTISVNELKESLASKDFTLVNVHIPYTAEIEGTDAFVPYNEIAQNLDQLPTDKNEKIVLYCQSGNMSAIAAQTLVDLGYTNVIDVPGGMIEWDREGFPLISSQ
ncbi:MAG: rhodanese-like domain-containing protein [Patescibacteria group bacterium UBA2163]